MKQTTDMKSKFTHVDDEGLDAHIAHCEGESCKSDLEDEYHATSVSYTPGPWKFSFESVDPEWAVVHNTLGGPVIANVNADHRQEANARLIAASPDLLETLRNLISKLEEMSGAHEVNVTAGHEEEYPEIAAARAAIEKATGK